VGLFVVEQKGPARLLAHLVARHVIVYDRPGLPADDAVDG
jgi:hypothetical protein